MYISDQKLQFYFVTLYPWIRYNLDHNQVSLKKLLTQYNFYYGDKVSTKWIYEVRTWNGDSTLHGRWPSCQTDSCSESLNLSQWGTEQWEDDCSWQRSAEMSCLGSPWRPVLPLSQPGVNFNQPSLFLTLRQKS